jgi:hypothetical protein
MRAKLTGGIGIGDKNGLITERRIDFAERRRSVEAWPCVVSFTNTHARDRPGTADERSRLGASCVPSEKPLRLII